MPVLQGGGGGGGGGGGHSLHVKMHGWHNVLGPS